MKVGDVFKLSSGKSLPEKNRVAGKYNVYGGNGITGSHNDYFVDEATVVIGRVGEYCGAVHLTTEKCWITDNALMVTEWYREVNKKYLVYMLNAMNLHQYAKTVGQPSISQANIYGLVIDLPSIEQQIEIVAVLNLISKIINSRKEELEQLDNLIKSRFVEMFGDLKVNEKGWEIKSFNEIAELITDGEHATPRRTDRGIYLLSARNVLNHSLQLEDVDYIDEDEYMRISKRIVPREGDVLISCSGTVGRCCSVPTDIRFQMVRSVAIVRFKNYINPKFAEYMIASDYLQEQIEGAKTASSQANLFQGKIAKLKGVVPPMELQKEFVVFVNQVDKLKVEVQKSLDETQLLMDSLMQEYFG